MTLTGPQKAALVLLSLDEAVAIDVMRHLDEASIRKLAESARSIDPHAIDALAPTLEEFEKRMSHVVLAHDADAYLRQLASQGLGAERAQRLFPAADSGTAPAPLDLIRTARSTRLATLLEEEEPQVAAVILAQLERAQAARVLAAMPEERQADLIGRLARLSEVPAEMVELASAALAEALDQSRVGGQGERAFDGVAFTAGLLNELDRDASKRLLAQLEAAEAALAPKVRDAMLVFEDLRKLDARAVQVLMREVPSDRVLIALKTADEDLRNHFLSAVSSRAAAAMRDDLAALPPQRLSDVEAAQREMVQTAQRLAAENRIVMITSGSEKLV